MSAVRHYTLEELQQKQEKAAQRQAWLAENAKRAAARERALKKKIARQEEEEKNRRLLGRGSLLEGLIENAPQLTDGQLEEILTIALRQDAVKKAIARMKPVAPAEPAPTLTGKPANKKSSMRDVKICSYREATKEYNKKAVCEGDQKGNVAQPSRRIKDKRLRRACGILDPACCQC